MKHAKTLARGATAAVLAALGVWAVGGCQGIAGIEDVAFDDGCTDYCTTMLDACRDDDFSQYEGGASCEATCATFGTSDIAEHANTLACRVAQAKKAASAPGGEEEDHCAAAGPGGGTLCTAEIYEDQPDCEGYCKLYATACETLPGHELGFLSEGECIKKCGAIERSGAYSVGETGDTLGCRLHHASKAIHEAPEVNCPAAGLFPTGACAPPPETETPNCKDYCRVVMIACTADFKVYESEEQCVAVCEQTPVGNVTDGEGDTLGCRTYHSYFALTAGVDPHCPHSGPLGNGQCSDKGSEKEDPNCISYCRLAKAGCRDEFNDEYVDTAGCLEKCRQIPGAEPTPKNYSVGAAQAGDTLQCRTLYAARALTDPEEKGTYCPAVIGGAPCK